MALAAVPTIDIGPLIDPSTDDKRVAHTAAAISAACTEYGFLQIVGHGIEPGLRQRLHDSAAEFFALDAYDVDVSDGLGLGDC